MRLVQFGELQSGEAAAAGNIGCKITLIREKARREPARADLGFTLKADSPSGETRAAGGAQEGRIEGEKRSFVGPNPFGPAIPIR